MADLTLSHGVAILERILTQNILPFWYPGALDPDHGGYQLNHDRQGRWRGPADKHVITQSRTLWFFSHLVNAGFGTQDHLAAAGSGFEFLRDCLWDEQYGGMYWAVDSRGEVPTMPDKYLCAQAAALYGVAEYARASGPEIKLMQTHLHVMEALAAHLRLTASPAVRERLLELILILSSAVVRKRLGVSTEGHRLDWTPLYSRRDSISYGHNLEGVWLLIDACETARLAHGPLLDLHQTIFDRCARHGYDRRRGGFYRCGLYGLPAHRREKVWWVQAEALMAALHLYRLTRDTRYADSFNGTLDWIVRRQVDWKNGDWHTEVLPSGKVRGDKTGPWRGPYHHGRAMLHGLAILSSLE